MSDPAEYDPRYLAGILFFNRHLYFDAHEVWEDVWRECSPEIRRFYQGHIQAAVALHHWGNGNWRGARRLFQSGRNYMSVYPPGTLGLEVDRFWQEMERALADILKDDPPPAGGRLDLSLAPMIQIDPAPVEWPKSDRFLPAT
jgi:predicted metal-dependent hydrolase